MLNILDTGLFFLPDSRFHCSTKVLQNAKSGAPLCQVRSLLPSTFFASMKQNDEQLDVRSYLVCGLELELELENSE